VPTCFKITQPSFYHHMLLSRIKLCIFRCGPKDVYLWWISSNYCQRTCCDNCNLADFVEFVADWTKSDNGTLLKTLRLRPVNSLSSTFCRKFDAGCSTCLGKSVSNNEDLFLISFVLQNFRRKTYISVH